MAILVPVHNPNQVSGLTPMGLLSGAKKTFCTFHICDS